MANFKNFIKKFLVMNTVTIGAIHLINKWISSSSVIKNLLRSDKGHVYHWKNGDVYYTKQGVGSPILLLHDITPYASEQEWKELIKHLRSHHTVYTVDLPGCGRSDKPSIKYTNYYYVQFITDFIYDVIEYQPDIAAIGMSSSFAIMAGKLNPNLYNRLIMINPASLDAMRVLPDEKSDMLFTLFAVPVIGTFLYYVITNKKYMQKVFSEKLFYNPYKIDQKLIDSCYEASHRKCGKGKYLFASMTGNYLTVDIRKALAENSSNISIIYGYHMDNEPAIVKNYKKLCPEIRTLEMREVKMLPHIEKAQETAEYITSFTEEL